MSYADPTSINYTCDTTKWVGLYGADKATQMNAIFQGCSPHKSFMLASHDFGKVWSGSSSFGAIAGFGMFGVMYLFTIVSIVIDIFKRQAEYEEEVANDKKTLNDLGIDVLGLDAELAIRL